MTSGTPAGRARKAPRTHPARVTRRRLLADHERWETRLTRAEMKAFSVVWEALYRIEGEDEAATPTTTGENKP